MTQEFIKEIGKYYIPGKVVIRADDETKGISNFIDSLIVDEQKPAVFVCENFKCNLPIYDMEQLQNYFKVNKINKEIEE